ncbi:MAG TPA: hypothetical protein VK475_08735 [Pyrinomonadaceae bacterium]|nr:hypothetical protein [Pyrinomonadaceae bacterium]
MGRSDGLGTDEKAIQPKAEMFENVASNNPSIHSGSADEQAMVSRSALLSEFEESSRGRPAIRKYF